MLFTHIHNRASQHWSNTSCARSRCCHRVPPGGALNHTSALGGFSVRRSHQVTPVVIAARRVSDPSLIIVIAQIGHVRLFGAHRGGSKNARTVCKMILPQYPYRVLSVMAGRTVRLSREYCLFYPNSLSQMQNDATPMPHLLGGSIGSNDVTYALVPVVRV